MKDADDPLGSRCLEISTRISRRVSRMAEDWVPWLVLALSALSYGVMTLTLSVLQPQSLAAMLGMASTESSDLNPGSAGDYRATRIVVTTFTKRVRS